MEFRNIRKMSEEEIVLEWNHPKWGWIPFTAVKDSDEEHVKEIWEKCYKPDLEYDVDMLKDRLSGDIIDTCDSHVSEWEKDFTQTEISSWKLKYDEAQKVVNGGSSDIIEMEASIRNETPIVLSNKIIKKHNTYNKIVVSMEAIKKNARKEILAANDLQQAQQIKNKYIKIIKNIVDSLDSK